MQSIEEGGRWAAAGRKSPDSTQQRILDAAEELFATRSFEATTLREIAHKVGIREPSLYAHFAGKDAIYGAVIDRALEPFGDHERPRGGRPWQSSTAGTRTT